MQEVDEEEFRLDPGAWHAAAEEEPVVVLRKGVPVLYLMPKDVFDSLYKGSRQALPVSGLDDHAGKALCKAAVSPEHDHLNALLEEED
ncbi:MAG: hypothetical protein GC185_13450 [Alphaproteobacteria bacterium]|nr:hypothetical protein [Alphaproteobacteria bacterium]